ncbi:MAG: hypothetical protein B6U94_02140 [Thermofilum sp. ex4484_79]|nr:MAG: hypothetical protein B6U94_02140 [Thermofilum sp. ex4484_79]
MKKLKAGLIGCGNIANLVHLPHLAKIENVDLTWVCDIVEEKAKEASKKYNVPKYITDYHEVVEDPEIDFVVITTPPDIHVNMTIDALKNGKHVFLEKPIAPNLDDAVKLYNFAKGKEDLKVCLGFCLRFHGMFKFVKELLDNVIGEPVIMWRNAIGTALGVAAPATWVFDKKRSGGMLVENAVHIFDAFRWFAGEYESVEGYVKTVTSGINIEDTVVASMRFKNDCFGSLTQTWTATHSWEAWGVVGKKGTVTVDGYILGSMRVSWKGEAEREITIKEDPNVMYYKEMVSFVDSIINDKPVFAGLVDGIRSMEAAIAIQISGEEKKPVKLPLVTL